MTNPRRAVLARVIQYLFGILALAFIYILFAGLNTKAPQPGSDAASLINQLNLGATTRLQINRERLWVSRFSTDQLVQIEELTPFVNNEAPSCESQKYCAFRIATEVGGMELMFTKSAPPQLRAGTPWVGGFVNPLSGSIYDLRGRAYLHEHLLKPSQALTQADNLAPATFH